MKHHECIPHLRMEVKSRSWHEAPMCVCIVRGFIFILFSIFGANLFPAVENCTRFSERRILEVKADKFWFALLNQTERNKYQRDCWQQRHSTVFAGSWWCCEVVVWCQSWLINVSVWELIQNIGDLIHQNGVQFRKRQRESHKKLQVTGETRADSTREPVFVMRWFLHCV